MLKNKITTGLMMSATALSLLGTSAVTAFADDTTPATSTDSAKVQLTSGDLSFKDETGTINTPSFDFGSHKVTAAAGEFTAENYQNTDTTDKYTGSKLAVTDLRGTGEGYNVTAKLGKLSGTTTPTHTLDGFMTTPGNAIKQESSQADATAAPTGIGTMIQTGGDAVQIMNAAKDTGMGTWSSDLAGTKFSSSNALYADTYTGSITYTLNNTPS